MKIIYVIRTADGREYLRTQYRDTAARLVRDAEHDPVMIAAGLAPMSFAPESDTSDQPMRAAA